MPVADPGAGYCRRSSRSSPRRSPVITIDHALTRNALTSSIMATELTGSDHRLLLANISVPVVPVWVG
jgi:endonuclease/exonuclease/phosphatase (EEP) superfamily protein YafD